MVSKKSSNRMLQTYRQTILTYRQSTLQSTLKTLPSKSILESVHVSSSELPYMNASMNTMNFNTPIKQASFLSSTTSSLPTYDSDDEKYIYLL
jgi:hypothetical protein